MRILDILQARDWPEPSQSVGMSEGTFGVQDGGDALLRKQLIPNWVVSMRTHMIVAAGLAHPMHTGHWGAHSDSRYSRRMEAELNAAVRHTTSMDPVQYAADLQFRVATINEISILLLPDSRKIREEVSPMHIRCTPFDHAHVALFAAGVEALGLPDVHVKHRLALGSPVAGDLAPTHSWEESKEPSRPMGLDFDDLPHEQWNAFLHEDIARRAQRSAESRETAAAVWERTIEELDKGLCDGPWSLEDMNAMYGKGQWRALRRFGVIQKESLRACDDAAENCVNDASISRDKMRCEKADFPARQADRFARYMGRGSRGWSLVHGTEDLESAYRRVTTMAPGYTVVGAWDPERKETRYFTLTGFNFGSIAAVTYFNAIPSVSASMARRLLGLVCSNFYDDFNVVSLESAGLAPQDALGSLHLMLGFPFSKKKRVPAAHVNTFCGVVTDFSRLATEGVVEVYVSDERKESLDLAIAAALDLGLTPGSAASLGGKLGFTLTWTFGRFGKAALQPILVRSQAKDHSLRHITPGLERAMRFLRAAVAVLPRREISVDRAPRPPVLVWSDAMYERTAAVPARGGFLIVVPAEGDVPERVYMSQHDTPSEVLRKFVPGKKQYIGQLELLYAVAPYTSCPDLFRGRQVIHFIDNTSACAALVKGYSRAIDSGLIVNAFHAYNLGLRADVFFEYVRSAANPADMPSRDAMGELWDLLGSVGLAQHAREVRTFLPSFDTWDAPADQLFEKAMGFSGNRSRSKKRKR